MLRRPTLIAALFVALAAGFAGLVRAQLEAGDRGILPIDNSGLLEIGGIRVDVQAKDSQSARYAGWRIAQREGFRKLYAQIHKVPLDKAMTLPDSTLDEIVSSINVEREEIGPDRYIATLGIMFDRARASQYLGVREGEVRRSVPMLLIPVTISGGTATGVELRNPWQRAWAQFKTNDSPIDYVRISGLGIDPLLVNAAQLNRPGRGWWRNIIDAYGAADILVAEVQLERLYPGGPARARFIARHGPDNEIIGGFTLTAKDSDSLPQMMAQGVQRMDALFARALAAGQLKRDSSLDLPPPPVEAVETVDVPVAVQDESNSYQIQITGKNVTIYNFAMAHLRTLAGIESVTPQQINANGTSYVLVKYRGDVSALASAMSARGWDASGSSTVVTIRPRGDKAPPIPVPAPATPPTPQAGAQPPPTDEQPSGQE